jgi:superfamily II DNA or RNA helicase
MITIAEGYKTAKTDKKTVIFEESTQVLEQVRQDFMDKSSFDENDIGAFYGDEKHIDAPVIVCTYASMKKMIKAVGKQNIGLVLCDEAHHILSENRQQVAQEFNGCCLYGFTATPDYNESKNCAQVFGKVIDSINLRQGVEEG